LRAVGENAEDVGRRQEGKKKKSGKNGSVPEKIQETVYIPPLRNGRRKTSCRIISQKHNTNWERKEGKEFGKG